MAKLDSAFSIISSCHPYSENLSLCPKTSSSVRFHIRVSSALLSVKSTVSCLPLLSIYPASKSCFRLFSVAQEVQDVVEEKEEVEVEKTRQAKPRRKLFVLNLPWSFSVGDIKNLLGECGAVSDVEIIKHKDGKNRGFAFVTMASGEAAQAAIDKLDSREVLGRIIRVDYSKKFKKPRPLPPQSPLGETRHKLYVSNLAWKVRANNLKEFFASNFNPVSARVVFDSPSGRSSGYGFVSFTTREEAETALSALDGKELLGRPIRLKFSLKSVNDTDNGESNDSPNEPEQSSVNESDNEEGKVSLSQSEES